MRTAFKWFETALQKKDPFFCVVHIRLNKTKLNVLRNILNTYPILEHQEPEAGRGGSGKKRLKARQWTQMQALTCSRDRKNLGGLVLIMRSFCSLSSRGSRCPDMTWHSYLQVNPGAVPKIGQRKTTLRDGDLM